MVSPRIKKGLEMKTTYVAQAFAYEVKKGKATKNLLSEQPMEFKTAEQAISRARRMSDNKDGAVAIAQQYEPESGELGDFEVLFSAGVLPPGLGDK